MLSSLLLAALTTAVPTSLQARIHNKSSDYVKVRNSLKIADSLMRVHDDTDIGRAVIAAEVNLPGAIRLIDTASVIDVSDISDNQPVPQYWNPQSGHLAVYRLLASAKRDLSRDNSLTAAAWLKLAVDQIGRAMRAMTLIVRNDFRRIDSLQRYQQITSSTFGGFYTGPPL